MVNPHTRLAWACQFTDHAVPADDGPVHVWIRLKDRVDAAAWAAGHGLEAACAGHAAGWVRPSRLPALLQDPAVADLEICEPLKMERPPPRLAAKPAMPAAPAIAGMPATPGGAPTVPAWSAAPAEPAAPPQAAGGPVLGIIDHGLPVLHPGVCRQVDGVRRTRFLALWDQDPQPDFGALGRPPAAAGGVFGAGAVLHRASIDAALALAGGDDARAYRALGYGALAARRTHGAHVLGLLAMDDAWVDGAFGLRGDVAAEARQADLLGVQLPRGLLDVPSRAALCGAVLDGLRWMLAMAGGRPLKVAVPYGSTLGPHDGSSVFEQALDTLIAQSNGQLTVFLPAGNSHDMGLHARLPAGQGPEAAELIWLLPPGGETASFVELWLPAGTGARWDLVDPAGRTVFSQARPDGRVRHAGGVAAASQAAVSWLYGAAPARHGPTQHALLLRFAPSLVVDSGRTACPSGHWRLRVHGLSNGLPNGGPSDVPSGAPNGLPPGQSPGPGSGHAEIHAYGSRARGSYGAVARGQQGRFLAAPGSAWVIDPVGSISGMATGERACVVGGHVDALVRANAFEHAHPARYTASGPGRNQRSVDYSLASEASTFLHGVRSAGTLPGVSWRMDGSSVAVPQAVRVGMSARGSLGWRHPRLGRPIVP